MGTRDLGLVLRRDRNSELFGYCDASWANKAENYKSISDYVFLLQGAAISWRSQKQNTVARSSTEAEYVSLADAAQKTLWLKDLCTELNIVSKNPVLIYSDNKGALELAKNAKQSNKTHKC